MTARVGWKDLCHHLTNKVFEELHTLTGRNVDLFRHVSDLTLHVRLESDAFISKSILDQEKSDLALSLFSHTSPLKKSSANLAVREISEILISLNNTTKFVHSSIDDKIFKKI